MNENSLTIEMVQKQIKNHPVYHYTRLMDYYRGVHHTILTRPSLGTEKPNNQLINNFPGYIVDVNLGYFIGSPIRYKPKKQEAEVFLEKIQEIFNYNDEQDENTELAKTMGIKGHAFELLYFDENAQLRFGDINPETVILIYDSDIEPNPLYAIRFWYEVQDINRFLYVEIYTKDTIYFYAGRDVENIMYQGELLHPFGDVPIIEYMNNDERQGDFEKVLSLIDAYDKAQSNTANDFEYFSDAYLILRAMLGTNDEDVASMQKNRVLLLPQEGGAEWLIKDFNDAATENFKSRLIEDIHKFSKTANLTDEQFAGNVSGVALQFKLWGMEQNTAQKERKFKKGLQRRIELISNYLSTIGETYDWRNIEVVFSRNVPQNLPDLVKLVVDLKGIVSDETLLTQLPFVDDPNAELDRMEKQEAEKLDLMSMLGMVPASSVEMDDDEEEDQ